MFVLGAGFSRALGAPLLWDLLVPRPFDVIKAQFPLVRPLDGAATAASLVHAMYRARMFCQRGIKERLWTHAEEFIDTAETAAAAFHRGDTNDPAAAALGVLFKTMSMNDAGGSGFEESTLDSLAMGARQALAADCSIFLRASSTATERWQPYREWAGKLKEHHTVVSFNYDVVPERLIDAGNGSMQVILPNADGGLVERRVKMVRESGRAPVLKLHGSTDWVRLEGNVAVSTGPCDEEWAVWSANNDNVVIGVPGPNKILLAGKVLKYLWYQARVALRQAEEIVFVGYRFPQSDAEARMTLLGAIAENRVPGLKVRIILGPENTADKSRLDHLLRVVVPEGTDVKALPLYAEDYLALVWSSSID